jgi:hypothetical protein
MRKDFVNEVARTQNVKRADLIEKDLILHQVLIDLSKSNHVPLLLRSAIFVFFFQPHIP